MRGFMGSCSRCARDEMAGPLSVHEHLSLKKVMSSGSLCGLRVQITHIFSPQSAEPIEKETQGWIENQISPLKVKWRWRMWLVPMAKMGSSNAPLLKSRPESLNGGKEVVGHSPGPLLWEAESPRQFSRMSILTLPNGEVWSRGRRITPISPNTSLSMGREG